MLILVITANLFFSLTSSFFIVIEFFAAIAVSTVENSIIVRDKREATSRKKIPIDLSISKTGKF
jgi:hypothetical protein